MDATSSRSFDDCRGSDADSSVARGWPFHVRHVPARGEVELPLRGKALRDKIVLRVIAVDRAFHFLILAILAVAVFLIASGVGASYTQNVLPLSSLT